VPSLSVVVPVLNEGQRLPGLLATLQAQPGLVREVLVVDGGSVDGSRRIIELMGCRLVRRTGGRGAQLATGLALVDSLWVLLLHADACLPRGWAEAVVQAMAQPEAAWYFELVVADPDPALRLVELAVGLRSRWKQRPYGDQGLLLPLALLRRCGGIRPLPLMEDLDLIQRLRRYTRLRSLGLPLRVDGRRWRRLGVWRTAYENARLRRAWHQGVDAGVLAAAYYGNAGGPPSGGSGGIPEGTSAL
jgi:rSAM/selenodomain-associated transferase 2